jgi:hypothetical protein
MKLLENFILACRHSYKRDLESWQHDLKILRKGFEHDKTSFEQDVIKIRDFCQLVGGSFKSSRKESLDFAKDLEEQDVCSIDWHGRGTIKFEHKVK